MKHVVFLADGMADQPVPQLDGKTPLEVAHHPNMDRIARYGRFGTARTVPEHMPAGSDTANLSVFGYDPERYYSGRSPLEAAYLGIEMSLEDVNIAKAVRTKEKNLADCIGKIMQRAFENQWSVPANITEKTKTSARVTFGIPSEIATRKIIREYYGGKA